MSLIPDEVTPETAEETIERLTRSNLRLASMVAAGSDRLQASARELMAQGWDAGALSREPANIAEWEKELLLVVNPYRQPINLPGATK